MAVGKEVKTKITSVKSTQKITSAMEMVAASKMRRAQDQMALGRPYAERIRGVVGHIANASPEYRHQYMTVREVKRVGFILISTDRGLCGGLNINLFKTALKAMAEWNRQGVGIDVNAPRGQSQGAITQFVSAESRAGDEHEVHALVEVLQLRRRCERTEAQRVIFGNDTSAVPARHDRNAECG